MKKIYYTILSFLLLVIFLEITLRFSGKLKTYSEKNFNIYTSFYDNTNQKHLFVWSKNDSIVSTQTEFEFSYVTNKYGLLKNHNYNVSNRDSTLVFLGDSFVFGVGANQDNSVTKKLEDKLNFNVVNAGIPGSDPFYESRLLDSIFYPLGYKKYLFMVNFSDFYDFIARGGKERFLPNNKIAYRNAPWIEPLYKKSLLFRAIIHFVFQYDFSLQSKNRVEKLKEEAINEFINLFLSLPEDVDFIVVLQPYARQYIENAKTLSEVLNYKYLETLEQKLIANNIKTINLDSGLKQVINTENYLDFSWKLDGHYNAKGYELLSEIITINLQEQYPNFLNDTIEN